MSKKWRSVGDWPEGTLERRPKKFPKREDVNNKAFDSMIKVTGSDTTFVKDTDDIRWVKHDLDTGGKVRETWRGEGEENRKISEVERHGEEGSSTGVINTARQSVYYPDGSLKGEITYNTDQELRTVKEYYPDGSVKRDVRALGAQKERGMDHHVRGTAIDVNPNNIISSKQYYPDGSIEYIQRGNEQGIPISDEKYWPDGKPRKKRSYDDQGRKHGKQVAWKNDGSIREEIIYDHGRIVSSTRLSKEEIDKRNKANGFN